MLAAKNCVPCKGGHPLSEEDINLMLREVPGWKLSSDGKWLERETKFKNFAEALEFANGVGEICEQENHHADFALGWGYCNLRLQTHDVGGLHQNDFVVAAKVNSLL